MTLSHCKDRDYLFFVYIDVLSHSIQSFNFLALLKIPVYISQKLNIYFVHLCLQKPSSGAEH